MFNTLRHIRVRFLLGWAVLWNLLLIGGIRVDAAAGQGDDRSFRLMLALALVITAIFSLAVLLSAAFRRVVLRPQSSLADVQRGLWLIAAMAGVGVVAALAA